MKVLPWEKADVRDENKMISLYIPEATKLKLKWLSDNSGVPQQKILRKIVVPGIDRQIDREIKKTKSEEGE